MAEKAKTFLTPICRLAFPAIAAPRHGMDKTKEPKYQATLIFDEEGQSDPRWKALREEAKRVAVEKFGADIKKIKTPFRDGKEKETLNGFGAGTMFFGSTSKFQPKLVGAALEVLKPEAFYAGCYVVARVHAYAYSDVNKGVTFALWGLQKIRDGDRLHTRAEGDGAEGDDFAPVDGMPSAHKDIADSDIPF